MKCHPEVHRRSSHPRFSSKRIHWTNKRSLKSGQVEMSVPENVLDTADQGAASVDAQPIPTEARALGTRPRSSIGGASGSGVMSVDVRGNAGRVVRTFAAPHMSRQEAGSTYLRNIEARARRARTHTFAEEHAAILADHEYMIGARITGFLKLRVLTVVASAHWVSEVEGAVCTSFCPMEMKRIREGLKKIDCRPSTKEQVESMTWEERYVSQIKVERLANKLLLMVQPTESIKEFVVAARCTDFHQVHEVARLARFGVEGNKVERARTQSHHASRKFKMTCQKSEARKDYPECSSRDCKEAARLLFTCFQPSHLVNEWPMSTVSVPNLGLAHVKIKEVDVPKSGGRVFQLTPKEAKVELNVVVGTIHDNSILALMLFDIGVSKSFVSLSFCKSFSIVKDKLENPLQVDIVDEKSRVVRDVYKGNVIEIEGVRFNIDLIPICMKEINVVVGIDWLGRKRAQIDCESSKIVGELTIIGDGKKKLPKVCSLAKFLALVIDSREEKREKVLVDVFSEDQFGIPPERQKSGGLERMCIDYKELKQIPLPRIDDLSYQLQGAAWFLKIDLRSGYHQLKVREEDVHKTVFSIPLG
ncbi:LOW QUALITY PROTEIN: hypothetical protein OSB04_023680 [Centaurea solstitialis]|uniref:Uncharacterized protein n=1 Tax=Centaurea solstitialis TaxID=347529 RepID=A0AA38SKC7_9ASTR|nr:LOW QUALITY PROTEIN: hypothetical protein OSB04_023680 [Centaurea solstitialis]